MSSAKSKKFFENTLSLAHFIRRQNVLSLYRDFMRTTSLIDNERNRSDTRAWIRSEFDVGRRVEDAELVQMHITRAKDGLRELKVSLEHAHSRDR